MSKKEARPIIFIQVSEPGWTAHLPPEHHPETNSTSIETLGYHWGHGGDPRRSWKQFLVPANMGCVVVYTIDAYHESETFVHDVCTGPLLNVQLEDGKPDAWGHLSINDYAKWWMAHGAKAGVVDARGRLIWYNGAPKGWEQPK